jgi:hypothetical protein
VIFDRYRFAIFAYLSLVVVAIGQAMGPVMHETDQAALLSGAWKLAQGSSPIWNADFYNYDKQYVCYWILAFLFAVFPKCDPVLIGNITSFAFYFLPIFYLLFKSATSRFVIIWILPGLFLAPLLWQHSPFLASNFISSGLIFMGLGFWRPGRYVRQFVASIFFGLAVGARADAIAILPFITLSLLPRRNWEKLFFLKCFLLPLIMGFSFFIFGRVLATPTTDVCSLSFNPKIFFAFTVFGLGFAAFIYCLLMIRLFVIFLHRSLFQRGFFYFLLFLSALPIAIFYSLQLFSTRHLTLLLTLALVFSFSLRGGLIFKKTLSFMPFCATRFLFCSLFIAFAVAPVFIGLKLPSPSCPSFSIGPGTSFPTADGVLSMGGYLPRLLSNKSSNYHHDQNHPIWIASKYASYLPGPEGSIRFLYTPLFRYYELACVLRNLPYSRDLVGSKSGFYMDSRSLRRVAPGDLNQTLAWILDILRRCPIFPVPNGGDGDYKMLFIGSSGSAPDNSKLACLVSIFAGNDFRFIGGSRVFDLQQFLGLQSVLISPKPFILFCQDKQPRTITSKLQDGFYIVSISGLESLTMRFLSVSSDSPAPPEFYVSSFPYYMDIKKY